MIVGMAWRERPVSTGRRILARMAAVAARVLPSFDRRLLVAFCVVHPINPMCCPTPCPVFDQAKVARFLGEAEQAWQKVEQCRQIADRYVTLLSTFGPNGPLATELRRVPGSVSGVFTTFQASYPSMLKAGDLGNPRAIAEILKTALFDPSNLEVVKLTGSIDRVRQRAAVAADEAVNALATGMHGYSRLTDAATDRGQQTVSASKAKTVRDDLAVNASARQALVDNLAGLKELLSSWAASEASSASVTRTTAADPLSSTTNSADASPLAVALQAQAARLDQLRQVRVAVNLLDATTSALTGLHNERHAATVMLAQYPGLWNTVASDNKAIEFRAADAAAVSTQLAQIFIDGAAAFQVAQARLLALDTTGWRDNATKIAAANAAAQSVVQDILAHPQAYGTVRADLAENGGTSSAAPYGETLAGGFAAWLEDDKLERFWAPLRRDAETAIASLDQRLKEISERRGFDIAGAGALAGENRLLDQFGQQLQSTLTVVAQAGQSVGESQQSWVSAYISAFQAAAGAVRSDSAATSFVTVRWPS
ncbi:hypothetical protein [Telmatospirillum siberiense]|uniref:hypothetical protein n=1 Tax=Telmatospirillum siberiense TaxID=382514 RepID=UPI0011AF727F|nr:hypothetical protein [Telmatospirillum siberiense]